MQDINWNDLRVFLAVAEAGQIARAARTLRLDPTTLGRRLRRLERQLETPLFERTREGQTLTKAGEGLLAKAEAMARAVRSIDSVRQRRSGLGGNLRLSVSEGFGSRFLTRYLPAFARSHPDLSIELVASSGFLSPSRREADLAVMLSRPQAGPVIARKLADYSLRLYASPDYLARHPAPAQPADLARGHRLVSYIPELLYAPELNYLDDFHAGLSADIRSTSINAQSRLIEEGAGIGVLPCFIGDQAPGLVPVCPDRAIVRSFWIVTHRDMHGLPRVRIARDWLLECVRAGHSLLIPD
ncbi:LysR family transcriptional regulator [Pelagerythrobacter marinus]|jgi:DNA-binding transcriptional LysR family regulator|uniref:LysR family transcriptional regulator n=1 Tax=Pelagerythrobacter marinus TaxID=538382 RepID=A0ABW9V0Q5_9SPHN|nr:LysR family transcriptional regulator [Pelagerythrobacter marinus]MEC9067295.1 LysR family transcriptional regulator [Pseudomonadota bacterium]MXO69515.1 LysR family transcriptional regulator [Pelagerythrobacter marinus]WPZ06421.1 LysR family transcriptional regulator [Pelagerythrobacter marinus]